MSNALACSTAEQRWRTATMSNRHALAAGIVSTVLLVGCSHVGEDSAESKLAWAAVSKAGGAYVRCVVETASRHATTDGKDVAPGDIADATVAECDQYLSAVEAAYYAIPLHSSQAREWMLGQVPQQRAKMAQEARGQAIDIVLKVRAAPSLGSNDRDDNEVARAAIEADNRGDYATELALFTQLADKGIPFAQLDLGAMYMFGKGTPKDETKAFTWTLRAAQRNDGSEATMDADWVLGVMYETGRGTPQDYVQAYKWYSLAVAAGDAHAVEGRDRVKAHLSRAQVTAAQQEAEQLLPAKTLAPATPSNQDQDTGEFRPFDQWQSR